MSEMSQEELLAMANGGIEMAVPVVWNMGVRFTEVRPGFVSAEVPFEGNGNHFGAMYAGVLATIGPGCAVCGAAMTKLDDVVEAAIEEALTQSCTVEMCAGNADLDVVGRIGALLRF